MQDNLPNKLAQKMGALSRALNIRVGAAQIGQLQTIINNPDYLDGINNVAQPSWKSFSGFYMIEKA